MPEDMLTPEFLAWAGERYGPAATFNDGPPIYPVGGPRLDADGPGGTITDRSDRRATKKNRRLVRKCNKARKNSSAKKKRFSKSKKCRKARSKLA